RFGPSQFGEMRAHPERHAKIVRERPDVKAARTCDIDSNQVAFCLDQLEVCHLDRDRRGQHWFCGRLLARCAVTPASCDLLGRKGRRLLVEGSAKSVERFLDLTEPRP